MRHVTVYPCITSLSLWPHRSSDRRNCEPSRNHRSSVLAMARLGYQNASDEICFTHCSLSMRCRVEDQAQSEWGMFLVTFHCNLVIRRSTHYIVLNYIRKLRNNNLIWSCSGKHNMCIGAYGVKQIHRCPSNAYGWPWYRLCREPLFQSDTNRPKPWKHRNRITRVNNVTYPDSMSGM